MDDSNRLRAGTLSYTRAGLALLFTWLLFGEFCYFLHVIVVRAVLPLTLHRHGANNTYIGFVMTTIPAVASFVFYPFVNTASDRTRTRWGRRLPFLFFAVPVNGACLILLAFSEVIGVWLSQLEGWSQSLVVLVSVAVCFAMFRMTDAFVGPIYYGLFNDVVPPEFLSRFIALFRIVSTAANAAFSYFLYQYAETNMREIFLGVGIAFLVGFTLMNLNVKEGQYPPPKPRPEHQRGLLQAAKIFMKECFTHRFYWYLFLTQAAFVTGQAGGVLAVFLNRDSLGLSLDQLGKVAGVSSVISMVLLYPAGALSDRVHPLRFLFVGMALQTVWSFTGLIWLFWYASPQSALAVYIAITFVSIPLGTVYVAAYLPMYMRLVPNDRFGQFHAAENMVSAVTITIGGVVVGFFIDLMQWFHGHGNSFYVLAYRMDPSLQAFAYRYLAIWHVVFACLTMLFIYLLYREWLLLGGREHFTPPDPDRPSLAGEADTAELQPGGK